MEFILPQHTIFYEIDRAIKNYRRMAKYSIDEAGYDLSVNQLILLIQLVNSPESTQVELSQSIFKDAASVARMVDLLVNKGYLIRTENPVDRRKKDLVATPSCRTMLEALIPVIQEYRKNALKGISQNDLEKTISVLNMLAHNCELSDTVDAHEERYRP